MRFLSKSRFKHFVTSTSSRLNFWGSGGDGALSTSGNVSLTSATDGDMIVKQYTSLTINSGHTLTVSNRCRGLLIYVDGDCTINGTLTMTARGCSGDPTVAGGSDSHAVNPAGLQLWRRSVSGSATYLSTGLYGCGNSALIAESSQASSSGAAQLFTIQRTGASGGPGVYNGNGSSGANGSTGQSGGGGAASGVAGTPGTGGNGGAGTCFSGGTGGGGGDGTTGGSGSSTGGAGGNAAGGCGGVGNPGGSGIIAGNSGTGGLLILLVRGNLSVGASGLISADGVANPNGMNPRPGGASGGGNILILYNGTLANSGIIRASGGVASSSGGGGTGDGGAGGNGSVQTAQILL